MTGRAATARRLYLHVLDGGTVTARDMARLVETIEELEADNERLRQQQANEGSNDNMAHHRMQPGQGKRL